MDNSILTLRTLGTFEMLRHGRQVPLSRTKHKALVAYLCLNKGKAFQRDHLADFLWERSAEDKAKHSLNQALYSIRRLLPELLEMHRTWIRCNEDLVRTDIENVHTCLRTGDIDHALREMRGSFLDDVDIKNAPEFESWKSDFNRHFYHKTSQVLEECIAGMSTSQRRRLQTPPHILSSLPHLRSLLEEGAAVHQENEGTVPPGSHGPFTLPFVGREEHLTRLADSFRACTNGITSFTAITGQPGHGKTRLADEFARAIDARVFKVKCHDAERRVGFAPIVDMLSNCFTVTELSGLQPIWRTVLAELAPNRFIDVSPPPQLTGLAGQSRLFEAFHQALIAVAKMQPLVIFIDDAQWADQSTRALFSYLTHTLRNVRVMVIAALRTKPPETSVNAPWNQWENLEVAELTRDQAAQVVSDMLQITGLKTTSAERILNLTGGHPYLLSEVLGRAAGGDTADLRILENEVAQRVEEFVGSLFQSLPKHSQTVLAVLALFGRPVSSHILNRVAKVENLFYSLDLLAARGLAAIDGNRVGLRHDLIREAAYRRIPIFTRTYLHRRVGAALRANKKHTGEAAEHFFKGGLRKLAFEHAIIAARLSDARHAYHETISFLRLAIRARPSQKAAVLPMLAERLYRVHRIRDAHAALRHAFRTTSNWPDDLRVLDMELRYALGKTDGSSLRAEISNFRCSSAALNSPVIFRLLKLEVRRAHHEGDHKAGTQAVSDLRTFAMQMEGVESLEAIAYAARGHSLLVSSLEGEKWVIEALDRGTAIPHNEAGIRIMGMFGTTLYEVGKLQAAEEMEFKAMAIAEEIGAINEWPLLAVHAHMLLVEQGKFDRAQQLALQIRHRVQGEGSHALAALAANEAAMYYEIQDYAAAEELSSETLKHITTIQSIWIRLEILGLRGLIFLAQGRRREARISEEAARTGVKRLGYRSGDVSYIEILSSRLAILRGSPDEAISLLTAAIADYRHRDVVCRLRMQLELAKTLKSSNQNLARMHGNEVFTAARAIGARPLAEAADALLLRL
jgi:tetratricopeptide (TPR) repeat protein